MSQKSYGQWLYERVKAGLPTDVPPPVGVETYEAWYKRIRGLSLLEESPRPNLSGAHRPSNTVPDKPTRGLRRFLGSMTKTLG